MNLRNYKQSQPCCNNSETRARTLTVQTVCRNKKKAHTKGDSGNKTQSSVHHEQQQQQQ